MLCSKSTQLYRPGPQVDSSPLLPRQLRGDRGRTTRERPEGAGEPIAQRYDFGRQRFLLFLLSAGAWRADPSILRQSARQRAYVPDHLPPRLDAA